MLKRYSLGTGLVSAALALALFAAVPAASASRWPGTQIRVCDRSGYQRNVIQAISWWNRTPSRVHLYRSCSRPQILVRRYFKRTKRVAGFAYYPPDGRVMLNHYAMSQLPTSYRADIAAHELGHALGLVHLPGCAVMFGGAGLGANCRAPRGRRPCGPQRHDVRALTRLYGGWLGDFRGFSCPGR